jgi:hypothetical protein
VGKSKKSRRKKLILWLCVDLAVAATVILLLLYKPAQYHPVTPPATDDPNGRRVHPYISHELMPTLYNNAQDRKPFGMEVLDQGLNEAIAQTRWRQESGGIKLSSPAVAFTPGRIVLMGTANIEGADFVVTVEIGPKILEDGRLSLLVEKVKIGVMNITWLARKIAQKTYREQVDAGGIDTEDWRTKIAASLLVGEPFEPVFPVEDKWIRLQSFDISQGKAIVRFVPVVKGHN